MAADLAEQEMTKTLALGFHHLAPSENEFVQVWYSNRSENRQVFHSKVEVYENPDTSGIPLKLVRVTVRYGDEEGVRAGVPFVLESLCSDDG